MKRAAGAVAGWIWLLAAGSSGSLFAAQLESQLELELGRNESRVYSAPFPLELGVTIDGAGLLERLERLGYQRVRGRRPEAEGQYFFGHTRFWVFRRAHRWQGRRWPPELIGLEVDRRSGQVQGLLDRDERPVRARPGLWLEPELLAESLAADRARRHLVELDRLPDHVWQTLLAAEDARFFDHRGLDGRSIARALLANLEAGRVTQGGSTISQQLIKMRDLTPKRSLGRKVSEAMRVVSLEADYTKEEILQAYLNIVYYGNLNGVAIHGIGTAALSWFGKSAERLTLAESATLAAMVQQPNRMSPIDDRERLRERQRWVFDRLEDLDWVSPEELRRARRVGLPRARSRPPQPMGPRYLLSWIREQIELDAPERFAAGRGFVVETTLDPLLQSWAEHAMAEGLARLSPSLSREKREGLTGALVALDGATGEVLAWVGGDPSISGDGYDRARRARRQPGSTVKPFVLVEAFDRCGARRALYPSREVVDRPVEIDLASGPWRPRNPDGDYRDVVTLRQATSRSLNVPFVRVARWCGFEETAARFRLAGLTLPRAVPPSFVLGAVEVSPFELAEAYTMFVSGGERRHGWSLARLETPGGDLRTAGHVESTRVARASTAYLVRDLLRPLGEEMLAERDELRETAFGKTGTSSESRDAWFVGGAGEVLASVWVGLDREGALGLTGRRAAAPIWSAFVGRAALTRPVEGLHSPKKVVRLRIDEQTGLRVGRAKADTVEELFRRGKTPPRKRWYRRDRALDPIE